MKKIVKLTESDLVRIVKRVISESSEVKSNPEQEKFKTFVIQNFTKMGELMKKGKEAFGLSGKVDVKQGPDYLMVCNGSCGQTDITLVDTDAVKWDFKKGEISGVKSFGIDPKPIPLNSSFEKCKNWFEYYWRS
jgi:hypothetical protein